MGRLYGGATQGRRKGGVIGATSPGPADTKLKKTYEMKKICVISISFVAVARDKTAGKKALKNLRRRTRDGVDVYFFQQMQSYSQVIIYRRLLQSLIDDSCLILLWTCIWYSPLSFRRKPRMYYHRGLYVLLSYLVVLIIIIAIKTTLCLVIWMYIMTFISLSAAARFLSKNETLRFWM